MSGEEVLARLIEITDEAIKIAKPRAVVNIINKGIGLDPFVSQCQKSDIEIYKRNVVCSHRNRRWYGTSVQRRNIWTYTVQIMNKIIAIDCDGVLLNWEQSFDDWMAFP